VETVTGIRTEAPRSDARPVLTRVAEAVAAARRYASVSAAGVVRSRASAVNRRCIAA
jgi:hypothetical protein